MIRTGAMVQLLLGNMGMPGGGVNALRGHSNIQGLTDIGLLSNLLTGYMTLRPAPSATRTTSGRRFASRCCPTRCRTGSTTSGSSSA